MHDVFYFTDIHGCDRLFNRIMMWIKNQDKESTIIFGGDACDRGNGGYQIMRNLLDDPYVIYLKGNHEDLFVKAADAMLKSGAYKDGNDGIEDMMWKDDDVYLAVRNGGAPTLLGWINDGASHDFVDRIRELPLTFCYGKYDFCHAGASYKYFKEVNQAEYMETTPDPIAAKAVIWDRNCWGLGWKKDRICVHGHTPTPLLPSKFYGTKDKSEAHAHPAKWYGPFEPKRFPGLKVDMDTGAVWTGRIWVLNVLTGKATSFTTNPIDSSSRIDIGLENFEI